MKLIQDENDLKQNIKNINRLFSNKTGNALSDEQIEKCKIEFDKLITNGMILPGSKDMKNKENSFPNKHYGDYIIFNEMIDYASTENKDLLFVTGDLKEVWAIKDKNKKATIIPELRKLFNEKAKQDIWLIDLPGFLKLFDDIEIDSDLLYNFSLNYDSDKDKMNRDTFYTTNSRINPQFDYLTFIIRKLIRYNPSLSTRCFSKTL